MNDTAILSADGALETAQQKSEGVWHAAWRRFKADRVGLVSLIIVLAFLALITLSGSGLVAGNWQAEVGAVSYTHLKVLISLLKAGSCPQVLGATGPCAGTAWPRRTRRISRSTSTASAMARRSATLCGS